MFCWRLWLSKADCSAVDETEMPVLAERSSGKTAVEVPAIQCVDTELFLKSER